MEKCNYSRETWETPLNRMINTDMTRNERETEMVSLLTGGIKKDLISFLWYSRQKRII